MTKPIEIISRALKDIGALEAGETPTPEAAGTTTIGFVEMTWYPPVFKDELADW